MTVYAEYNSPDRQYTATVHTDGHTFLYNGMYWVGSNWTLTDEQQSGLALMKTIWLCYDCNQIHNHNGHFGICDNHKAQLDSIKWDPSYLLELKDGEIGHS